MTDLDTHLEQEHRDLTQLPADYADLHHTWSNVGIVKAATDTPSRRMPTSRWPAGRDPEAARRLAKVTLHLTVAHGWCNAYRFPTQPWTGHETAGLTVCRTCHGEGWYVRVDEVDGGDRTLISVQEATPCWPCDRSGVARHDLGQLALMPPHPATIRTAVNQLRGYLAALQAATLTHRDTPTVRKILNESRKARKAATPDPVEQPTVEPCGNCRERPADKAGRCHACYQWRLVNGGAERPKRLFTSAA